MMQSFIYLESSEKLFMNYFKISYWNLFITYSLISYMLTKFKENLTFLNINNEKVRSKSL